MSLALVSMVLPLYAQMAPDARIGVLQTAAQMIERHDVAGADSALATLLKSSPDDAVALNLMGLVRVQQQDPDDAEKLFRLAIEKGLHLVGPRVNLATLCAKDRPAEAIAQLREALKVKPDYAPAQELLRRLAKSAAAEAARNGHSREAAALLMQAREALPSDADLLVDTALAQMEIGQPGEAETILREALRVRPNFPKAIYALARACLAQSKADEAEAHMRSYLRVAPDDATANYGLGYILLSAQKREEARSAFVKSLELQPEQTESLFQLGEIDLQQGAREHAEQQFAAVLARDPHHAGALTEMGMIAYRKGEYAKALADLELAANRAPAYQKAHYFLGLTLNKLGKAEEAQREFRTSSDLQKRDGSNAALWPPLQ